MFVSAFNNKRENLRKPGPISHSFFYILRHYHIIGIFNFDLLAYIIILSKYLGFCRTIKGLA